MRIELPDALEACAACGSVVDAESVVYRLTLPEGMTREEARALGPREAGRRGVRLEAICSACRAKEAES